DRAKAGRLTVPGGNGQRDRPMVGPSFRAVLAAAAAGDEAAFRVLWRDLQPGLLRYLSALAPGAGEDLASDTSLRVRAGLAPFSGDERAFRAWVFPVARHRAVDRWRRGTRRHDELVPLEALAELPAVDDPAEAALDAISTQAAVALPSTPPRLARPPGGPARPPRRRRPRRGRPRRHLHPGRRRPALHPPPRPGRSHPPPGRARPRLRPGRHHPRQAHRHCPGPRPPGPPPPRPAARRGRAGPGGRVTRWGPRTCSRLRCLTIRAPPSTGSTTTPREG